MKTIKDFEEFEIEYQLIKYIQELEESIQRLNEHYEETSDELEQKGISERIMGYRLVINDLDTMLYDNDIDSTIEEE